MQLELTVVKEVLIEHNLLLLILLDPALSARVAPALLIKRLVGQSYFHLIKVDIELDVRHLILLFTSTTCSGLL